MYENSKDRVPTLEDLANSCYERGGCSELQILMSYCKECDNYNKKLLEVKQEKIERVTLEEVASKCLKDKKCKTIKIIMPFCKMCENYNKKLGWLDK